MVNNGYNQYMRSKIMTASKPELTLMLYDGAIKFCNMAIMCIEKKDSRNEVPLKIMNYVKENYSDQTISLKKISLVFGLSENYISAVFKEAYNSNLSNVIEELRIKKACEFIKNTNMKMNEIAECVGYANDTSFRRAFKRVTGVSPSEFKDI